MAEFLSTAAELIGLTGAVSVLLTESRRMRGLNRRFRGKNKTTDVLSFPAPAAVADWSAGDLAISIDSAGDQAARLGHSLEAEIKVLALHGLLHLAGWDHEKDAGEMADVERRLRSRFDLPTVLTERAEPIDERKSPAKVNRKAGSDRAAAAAQKARRPRVAVGTADGARHASRPAQERNR